MTYLERVAQHIRDEVPNEALPPEDTGLLFLLYGVLLLAKGQDVSAEDVHNAWTVWMTSKGETHPAMIPYAELATATQAEDEVFVRAIHRAASSFND